MIYADNDMKFVAVLNKRHSAPTLFNAVAHLSAGLVATLDGTDDTFVKYECPAGDFNSSISRYPFIVLRADNSNQLKRLVDATNLAGIRVNVFTTSMLGTSCAQQVEATRKLTMVELDFVAVTLFGDAETMHPMIRKYSLFRE